MLGSGVAWSPRCRHGKDVSRRGPPASSVLHAGWTAFVDSYRPPIVLHVPARTQFPPGRWYLPTAIPTVGPIRLAAVRSPSMIYQPLLVVVFGHSFFVRASWLVSSDRRGAHRSHVDSVKVNSVSPFSHTASFPSDASRRRSHSLLGAVVGLPHVPSFTAPPWSASGHSLGNVWDVVPVRPFSVDWHSVGSTAAVSASTVKEFVTPARLSSRRFDSSVASSHLRQPCSFVSLAALLLCPGLWPARDDVCTRRARGGVLLIYERPTRFPIRRTFQLLVYFVPLKSYWAI